MIEMTQRKRVLADHKKIGKKLYPRLHGVNEINYVEHILPEIAWIGYFMRSIGERKGIETAKAFIESFYSLRNWEEHPNFCFLSSYCIPTSSDWTKFKKQLKGKGIFLECLHAITPFFRCYPTGNPFSNLLESKVSPSEADVDLARAVISDLFDRRSRQASLIQSVVYQVDINTGKFHASDKFPLPDFNSIYDDFESELAKEACAQVRCHTNMIHMMKAEQIGTSWSKYFWNRGTELTPIKSGNVVPEISPMEELHPLIRFGLDYERYAWSVVDAVWSKLPITIYESEFFEVIGALLARQCNLAVKLAANSDLWDYHAGPLFLRPMTDCYITVAWILKDRIDRARKFILYGLGQEKLQIAHLKSALEEQKNAENRKHLEQMIAVQEAWLNGQHYSFLQHVDLGSWSGINTREMAEEAGCLNLYNFAYIGWSHAAHGTWNHIGRFDALPTSEPLHKHIWQPANLIHDHQIDVVIQATKYFDELCVLLVTEFNLQMEIPNPNAWLQEQLAGFFTEVEK